MLHILPVTWHKQECTLKFAGLQREGVCSQYVCIHGCCLEGPELITKDKTTFLLYRIPGEEKEIR